MTYFTTITDSFYVDRPESASAPSLVVVVESYIHKNQHQDKMFQQLKCLKLLMANKNWILARLLPWSWDLPEKFKNLVFEKRSQHQNTRLPRPFDCLNIRLDNMRGWVEFRKKFRIWWRVASSHPSNWFFSSAMIAKICSSPGIWIKKNAQI